MSLRRKIASFPYKVLIRRFLSLESEKVENDFFMPREEESNHIL